MVVLCALQHADGQQGACATPAKSHPKAVISGAPLGEAHAGVTLLGRCNEIVTSDISPVFSRTVFAVHGGIAEAIRARCHPRRYLMH